jgi:hypothetical protein
MSSVILPVALSLPTDERIVLMQALLDSLKAQPASAKPSKATKAKKAVTPSTEPKEATWWVKATGQVRSVLKPVTDAHNAALPEGAKKVTGTAALSVASALKKAGLLAEGLMPSDAMILAAFKEYMANPPEPKAGSVSSATSAGSKPKAAKAPLSDEEAAVAKAAKAAKAKATRERNKVAKAAAAAAPVVEAFTDMPWFHEGRSYTRIGNSLWDSANDAWVGEYDEATNSIDISAAEPERVYE